MQSWDLLIWYVQNRKGKLDFLFWQKLNRMGKRKHKGLSNSHIFPYKIKRFMWLTENNAILTKDNPIIDTGWGLRLATSVMRMNQWTIFAFNVVLLKQFGESLGYVSMQVTFRKIFKNIELGSQSGFPGVKPSILVAALQFVGLSGSAEIWIFSQTGTRCHMFCYCLRTEPGY